MHTYIYFCFRVNAAIAEAAGLRQVEWDGFIKVLDEKPEENNIKRNIWIKRQQQEFAKLLQQRPM